MRKTLKYLLFFGFLMGSLDGHAVRFPASIDLSGSLKLSLLPQPMHGALEYEKGEWTFHLDDTSHRLPEFSDHPAPLLAKPYIRFRNQGVSRYGEITRVDLKLIAHSFTAHSSNLTSHTYFRWQFVESSRVTLKTLDWNPRTDIWEETEINVPIAKLEKPVEFRQMNSWAYSALVEPMVVEAGLLSRHAIEVLGRHPNGRDLAIVFLRDLPETQTVYKISPLALGHLTREFDKQHLHRARTQQVSEGLRESLEKIVSFDEPFVGSMPSLRRWLQENNFVLPAFPDRFRQWGSRFIDRCFARILGHH